MDLLLILLKLKILIQTVNAIQHVGIHRVPDQPIQLYSGGSVVLLCTVTTSSPNSTVQIEWFNSSQSIQQVTNSIYITQPYYLGSQLWQSGLDLRILTVDYSGSYHCQATDESNNQLISFYHINVEDTSVQSSASISILQNNLHAQIPFSINSTLQLPSHVSLQVQVQWYRNNVLIEGNTLYHFDTVQINNTHVISGLVVTEPFPAIAVSYSCVFIAESYGVKIFTLNRTTTPRNINSYPKPPITITTSPITGPIVDRHYIVTCFVSKPVNGTLTVSWRRNELLVKSVDNVVIDQPINTATSTSLHMTFNYNINAINEGTYICTASLLMEDYNIVLSNSAEIIIKAPGRVLSVQVSTLALASQTVLSCVIETNKAINNVSIKWEDNNGPLPNTHNITKLTDTVYQNMLELYAAQLYYCDAYVNGSLQRSQWYYVNSLIVNENNHSRPISVVITKSSSLMIQSIGDDFNMTCTSTIPSHSLPITIEWKRANGIILQSDEYHTISSLSTNLSHAISILTFHSLQVNDADQYLCSVSYDGSSLQRYQGSDSIELLIKAPSLKVTLIPVNKKRVTCLMKLNDSISDQLKININWTFQLKENLNTVTMEREQNRVSVSELNIISCGKEYSQHIDLTIADDDSNWWSIYYNITCQVNVSSSSIANIIDTITSDSMTNTTLLSYTSPPSLPNNITITNIGSYWTVIQWTSSISQQYEIQYYNQLTHYTTSLYYSTAISSMTSVVYAALLTNLIPGTRYNVTVVVSNEVGMKQTKPIEFTTNETIPTGSPINFSYQVTSDRSHLFTWLPPETNKRNGIINRYQFGCIPPITPTTFTSAINITVTVLLIPDTNYTCSVAAINKAGVGPSTTIAFNNNIRGVGDLEESAQSSSLNTYLLIPVNGLLLLTVMVIVVLTVATCYYKKKSTSNFFDVSAIHSPIGSSSPHTGLNRPPLAPHRKQSQRYVSTDTVEFLWQKRHSNITDNDSSRAAPDLTITRQESLV